MKIVKKSDSCLDARVVSRMAQFLVKWMCRLILFVLGWTPSDGFLASFECMKKGQRFIGLNPHTSVWDAVYGCLFRLGYDALFFKNLMAAKWYNRWYVRPLAKYLGFIPVYPTYDGERGGSVAQIAKYMEDNFAGEGWMIGMSPIGSRQARAWKTGFFHLARATKSALCITGLDYETKQMVFIMDKDMGRVLDVNDDRINIWDACVCAALQFVKVTPKFPIQSIPNCHRAIVKHRPTTPKQSSLDWHGVLIHEVWKWMPQEALELPEYQKYVLFHAVKTMTV
jgi:1-acyl-sn-glycerol-3-phosphate acyltransferase